MISRRGLFGAFASVGVGLALPPAEPSGMRYKLISGPEEYVYGVKLIAGRLDPDGTYHYTLECERSLKYIVLDVTIG